MEAEETGIQRSQKRGQGDMGLGILGRRQVKPRWENFLLWLHDGRRQESDVGWVRAPPPDINHA